MSKDFVGRVGLTLSDAEIGRLVGILQSVCPFGSTVIVDGVDSDSDVDVGGRAVCKVNAYRRHLGLNQFVNSVRVLDQSGQITQHSTGGFALKTAWDLGFRYDDVDHGCIVVSQAMIDLPGRLIMLDGVDRRPVKELMVFEFKAGACWYKGPYRSEDLARMADRAGRNRSWEELVRNPSVIILDPEAAARIEHLGLNGAELRELVYEVSCGVKDVDTGTELVVFVAQEDLDGVVEGLRGLFGDAAFEQMASIRSALDDRLSNLLEGALPEWVHTSVRVERSRG